MESNNELKKLILKIARYYFDGIIDLNDICLDNILLDEHFSI